MEFAEALGKLRARMLDAVRLEVGKDNPAEFTLAALVQVMNEAERHRQDCVRQMQSYRELAKAAEHQASAYGQVNSVVWAVYNGLIEAEERTIRERQEREAEAAKLKAEQAAEEASLSERAVRDIEAEEDRRGLEMLSAAAAVEGEEGSPLAWTSPPKKRKGR